MLRTRITRWWGDTWEKRNILCTFSCCQIRVGAHHYVHGFWMPKMAFVRVPDGMPEGLEKLIGTAACPAGSPLCLLAFFQK
jgi:hypothetical protein